MKKYAIVFIGLMLLSNSVYAYDGEMGYFGGITAGVNLTTTIQNSQGKVKTPSKYSLPYKETLYITGKAVEIEGTIDFKPTNTDLSKTSGKYSESYVIKASSSDGKNTLTRSITLETQYLYRSDIKQVTKNSKMTKWSEIVSIDGKNYQLDQKKSNFYKSTIEDYTPGVMYYKGDIGYEAVYKDLNNGNSLTTVEVNSPIYGYSQQYSKSEVQNRDIKVTSPDGEYFITDTPSYVVNKEMQYSKSEPNAISIEGNYREIIGGTGNSTYTIIKGNEELFNGEYDGNTEIVSTSEMEQLALPKIANVKGHPAITDIEKLYSLQIIPKDSLKFSPNAIVTRGEYIEMIVKALGIKIPEEKKKSTKEPVKVIFSDLKDTDTVYKYALAAYNSGLISGGAFNKNQKLTREQFYTITVKALGLERLGISSSGLTPFLDDKNISGYAKSSVYAASKLGILPIENGYMYPKRELKYSEFSALMCKVIDYMRYDLQKDYTENMRF